MSAKTKTKVKAAGRRGAFATLVERQRERVIEHLQLYGDLPLVTHERAIEVDWIHVLLVATTDVVEEARKVSGEDWYFARRMLRKQLAQVVAVCEAWEKRV